MGKPENVHHTVTCDRHKKSYLYMAFASKNELTEFTAIELK